MAASAACCKQLNLFLLLLARGVFLPSLTRCSAAKQLMFLDNKSNTKLAGPPPPPTARLPLPLSARRSRHHTHGPVFRRERAESLRKGEPCCELFIIPFARLNFSIENISTPASPARIDVRRLSRRGKYPSKVNRNIAKAWTRGSTLSDVTPPIRLPVRVCRETQHSSSTKMGRSASALKTDQDSELVHRGKTHS